MKPIQYAGIFALAACAAFAAAASSPASAWFVRKHASACYTQGGLPIDVDWGIQNDSTTSDLAVLCPVEDETSRLKQNTNTLNVHGLDNSTAAVVRASACRGNYAVSGGSCASYLSTDSRGTGHYWLTIPTASVWNASTASDFGYTIVVVPRKQGSFRSTFRGYYQAGT
jgi:hypothetical protein